MRRRSRLACLGLLLPWMLLPWPLGACAGEPPEMREPEGLLDLSGRPADPRHGARGPVVFLFVRDDCPVANRYAPEMKVLWRRFSPQGISFWLVYPDPAATPEAIRRHREEFDLPLPALRDREHRLAAETGVEVTPEAAVFDASGRLVYRGRIDDRWSSFGRSRPEPTRRDLAEVLQALAAGETVTPRTTEAVGCYVDDLR